MITDDLFFAASGINGDIFHGYRQWVTPLFIDTKRDQANRLASGV